MEDCLGKIRQIRGHERFLLEPTIDELKDAATAGPIVVVNVTDMSANALIVSSNGIKAIPLAGLWTERTPLPVQQELRRYESFTRGDYDRDMESETDTHVGSDQLSWLRTNCVELVLDEPERVGLLT